MIKRYNVILKKKGALVQDIVIVIPLYNKSYLTKRCFKSLIENSSRGYEISIVDNGSCDDTQDILKEEIPKLEKKGWKILLQINKENVGFGRAMNQGVRAASHSRYFGLLNNDTWLMKNWDIQLLEAISSHNVDMVSPYFYEKEFDEEALPGIADKFVKKNRGKIRNVWGGPFMFFKQEAFEGVGMFDESYFVGYEDLDLKYQFVKTGRKFVQVGDCLVWHHGQGTQGDLNMCEFNKHGLKVFMDKWGVDPRPFENTYKAKIIRKWRKIKDSLGHF